MGASSAPRLNPTTTAPRQMKTLIGPDRVHHGSVVSAPEDNGLALAYNEALAITLELIPDEQLAQLAVRLRYQLKARPAFSTPDRTDLAVMKVEEEAGRLWNLQGGGNQWLICVLRGDLFLPD